MVINLFPSLLVVDVVYVDDVSHGVWSHVIVFPPPSLKHQ